MHNPSVFQEKSKPFLLSTQFNAGYCRVCKIVVWYLGILSWFCIIDKSPAFSFDNALYFPRLESAIPLILREMKKPDLTNVSVAFPDEGAFKRFHSMFEKDFPLITCIKIREEGRRSVKIKEGRPYLIFTYCVVIFINIKWLLVISVAYF